MKKFFTLFAFALIAIAASAQEPLYTIKTIVTNDASWNENEEGIDYAPYFAFQGTEVEVEVYADDYVIIKNWAGAEGCDLKVEYDSSVDVNAEDCYGNILSITSIINGVEQEALTYEKDVKDEETGEDYTYKYVDFATGRTDFPVCSTSLNEDGTFYWSFVEVDKENKTGYVELTAYFASEDYSTFMDEQYYYVGWPQAEEPQEAVFYGTFDAETTDYEDAAEGDVGFPIIKGIKVDAYSDHAIVYGIGGVEGYNMIVTYDEEDNVTSITPPSKDGGNEYAEVVTSGYSSLYTGLSDDWRKFQPYLATQYCYGGADETGGYILLWGYNNASVYSYYYIIWGEDDDAAVKSVDVNNAANGAMFNLAGQKVNATYKGVVIKNGKKMVIK